MRLRLESFKDSERELDPRACCISLTTVQRGKRVFSKTNVESFALLTMYIERMDVSSDSTDETLSVVLRQFLTIL